MFKYALVVLFVLVLLYNGLVAMRGARTVNDFFLGGRQIGPWLSAFSFGTAYFSAVIFIGYAGKVGWGFGLSGLWIVLGNAMVGSLLAWIILARRSRAMSVHLGTVTMPEFLEARYQSRGIKIFSALIIFVFLVPYSASVYMGLSYLFNQVFGVPYVYAATFMCLLTALYLVTGGYRALALTDFFLGSIMVLGVGVLIYYVLGAPQVQGLAQGVQNLAQIDPGLVAPVGPPGWLPLFSLVVLTSLGTWGLPQMVQKFYAIKSEAAIKPATVVASIFALVVSFGAYFTGATTRLFFDKLPVDPATGQATPDLLMPILINNVLPELAVAIILLLVLSASMSTLASLVLVSGSSIAIDLFRTIDPVRARRHGVAMLRVMCLVFIILSLLLALSKPAIILSLMAMSWGTVAGVFLAPYLYGLFWRRTTTGGAWAGAITGFIISVGFSLYYKLDAGVIPLIGSLAMLVPLVVVPVVSLLTPELPPKHVQQVFSATTRRPGKQEQF